MSKPINALKRILEIVWLIVAILALGIAIRETMHVGFGKSYYFFLFSIVAFFFYYSRRKERINKK